MLEKGGQPNISCQTLSFRNNDLYSDTDGKEYELPFFIFVFLFYLFLNLMTASN